MHSYVVEMRTFRLHTLYVDGQKAPMTEASK